VVHGFDGLDEITLTGETQIAELKNGKVNNFSFDPKEFGYSLCSLADLKGAEPETNAEIMREILKGSSGPKTDIVILNAAAAIYVGGKADSIEKGILVATNSIESGAALKKLEELCRVSNS
jgi:anthranilate phosphoribosyltransferase